MANQVKRVIFISQLEEAIINVEIVVNQIKKLNENTYELDKVYIDNDLLTTSLNLELELALLAIILRKMRENNYLTMNEKIRVWTNSLIHSNRFSYQDNTIEVFSFKGQVLINLDELLAYAKSVIR